MRRFIFIILFSAALMAASCVSSPDERNADATLSHVEDIMSEYPDSALRLLSDSNLHPQTQRQKALYALLLTQARHKNYIDETNDSLIATAVDYFDRKGDEERLMKSLFYHATINSNAANYPAAMTSAMQALKLAEQLNDTYWKARIAEIIGHLFSETYFFEDAINYNRRASQLYVQTNIPDAHLFSLIDMAINYSNLRDYERGQEIIDSVLIQSSSPDIIAYSAYALLPILINTENFTEGEAWADSLLKYKDRFSLTSQDYANIYRIKLENGKRQEAQRFLDLANRLCHTAKDSLAINVAKLYDSYKSENLDSLNTSLNNIINSQDNIAGKIIRQSVISTQRDFYAYEMSIANLTAERRRYIILIISISLCVIILLISLFFKYKIRFKNEEINRNVAQLLYLTKKMEEDANEINRLYTSAEMNFAIIKDLNKLLHSEREKSGVILGISQTLFQERLHNLNFLFDEFYNCGNSQKEKDIIYKNIQKEIDKLTSPKNLAEIEKLVNYYMNDILVKIHTQVPSLSHDELSFLTLRFYGYGAKAIAQFTDIKSNSTYTKCQRIIAKILSSDAPDKEWFISLIEKPAVCLHS